MDLQNILNKWGIDCEADKILERWREPHRFYHGIAHLEDLLSQIESKKGILSEEDLEKLAIAALFHDAIYDPMSEMNEEDSAALLLGYSDGSGKILDICQIIIETKTHIPSSEISSIFCEMDMDVAKRGIDSLLEWESGISKEYSAYSKEDYKKGRVRFLESISARYPENAESIEYLIGIVRNS